MLDKARARMKDRLAEARIRETRFLMSFNMASVNNRLIVLLSVYIALNFFDALTTLLAIHVGPTFVELNPIASGLFHLNFDGFMLALLLKYLPAIPLVYATFLRPEGVKPLTLRVVKVSAFVALAAADIFYGVVVGSNTLNLTSYYLAIS